MISWIKQIIYRFKEVSLRYRTLNINCSNLFLFNWNINDKLYIFVMKARLSLFWTNFALYLWNWQNNRRCSFGCFHTESMAHVLNGCIHHFSNFYSRRYDRVVEIIASFVKQSVRRYRTILISIVRFRFLR